MYNVAVQDSAGEERQQHFFSPLMHKERRTKTSDGFTIWH